MDLIDKMSGLRNIIVHGYDKIDNALVYGLIKKKMNEVEKIKEYFEKLLREIFK